MEWRRPGHRADPRDCAYCGQAFTPARKQSATCSTACRVAKHRARKYTSVADVPPAAVRRSAFSLERRAATGIGLLTAAESFEADCRIVTAGEGTS